MTPATSDRALLNIVLVEDDDAEAKAVRRAFDRARIANSIVRVTDGVEARRLLRGEAETPPPDSFVLLVDLNMPRMGGIELLQEIRRAPRLTGTVAFVMTTSDDERDRVAAYRQHAAGYIVKQNAGTDFMNLVSAIDHYWRIVELPELRQFAGA